MKEKTSRRSGERLHRAAAGLRLALMTVFLLCSFATWKNEIFQFPIPKLIWIQDAVRVLLTVLLLEKFSRAPGKAVLSLGIAAVAWYSAVHSSYFDSLDFFLFLLSSDLAEEKQTMRVNLWAHLSMLAVLGMLIGLGLTSDKLTGFSYGTGHTFGMDHSNFPAAVLLALLMILWFMYLKKHPVWTAVLFFCGAALCLYVMACRTVAVLMILFPVMNLAVILISRTRAKKILAAMTIVPVLCFLVSLGLTMIFVRDRSALLQTGLDLNMLARFSEPAEILRSQGASVLGRNVGYRLSLDNLYMRVLLFHGAVGIALYLAAVTVLMAEFFRRERYDLMTVLSLMLIYGMMECIPMAVIYNFIPLIALGAVRETAEETDRKPMTVRGRCLICAAGAAAALCAVFLFPNANVIRRDGMLVNYGANAAGESLSDGTEAGQSFAVTEPMEGIRIRTATNLTQPLGLLTFTLEDDVGKTLEQRTINMLDVHDNSWLTIFFDETRPAGNYTAKLQGKRKLYGAVRIWENTDNPYPDGAAALNGEETGSDWVFSVVWEKMPPRQASGIIWGTAFLCAFLFAWMVPAYPGRRKNDPV